jgi:hypothetical protein
LPPFDPTLQGGSVPDASLGILLLVAYRELERRVLEAVHEA